MSLRAKRTRRQSHHLSAGGAGEHATKEELAATPQSSVSRGADARLVGGACVRYAGKEWLAELIGVR